MTKSGLTPRPRQVRVKFASRVIVKGVGSDPDAFIICVDLPVRIRRLIF